MIGSSNSGVAALAASRRPRLDINALLASLPGAEGGRPAAAAPTLAPPDRPAIADVAPVHGPSDFQDGASLAGIAGQPVNIHKSGIGGALQNIGDFIHSDEGRAALLRSAGATWNGGLGAGITAGANYVDTEHHDAEAKRQFDMMQALRERAQGNQDFTTQDNSAQGWGQLGVQAAGADETSRHNRAGEGLTGRAQDIDWRLGREGHEVAREGNQLQAQVGHEGNQVSAANNVRSTSVAAEGDQLQHDASVYGSNMGYAAATQRAAGVGSNAARRQVTTVTRPGHPGIFSDTPPQVTQQRETVTTPLGDHTFPQPPAPAIQALRDNPGLSQQFEQMYGPGSSQQFLGGR